MKNKFVIHTRKFRKNRPVVSESAKKVLFFGTICNNCIVILPTITYYCTNVVNCISSLKNFQKCSIFLQNLKEFYFYPTNFYFLIFFFKYFYNILNFCCMVFFKLTFIPCSLIESFIRCFTRVFSFSVNISALLMTGMTLTFS